MVASKIDPARAFLGVGWEFPLSFGSDGTVSLAAYEDDVRQAIRIILATNPGERVMRPEFGAGLDDFVFAPVTAGTRERLRTRVRDALIDWEPRIDVEDVTVDFAGPVRNRLDITIRYRVRATNALHNLVYPFYLDQGEAP
jgi:uncharacterized protein